MPTPPRDRFDEIPTSPGRIGAHRAENPRVRGWTTLLWALGATIVLVAVGIFGTFVSQGRITLFPAPAPSVVPSVPTEPVVDTSYSVLVLNGTSEEGLATRMKDTLIENGWAEADLSASNANDRAFPTTTVYYTAPAAEAAALGLAQVVGGAKVMLDPDYPFPGTPETQLTLVLGMDRLAPAPSETPAP